MPYALDEGREGDPVRQACPLYIPKPLRHPFVIIRCVVDGHRQQECSVRRHQMAAVDREFPLETEVAFIAGVRAAGDDREEERAGLDLLADRLVPGIPAAQLALVEPDLDAGSAERLANPLRSLCILRGVA